MSLKIHLHSGNTRPETLYTQKITVYLADGSITSDEADTFDWRSGLPDSVLAWANGADAFNHADVTAGLLALYGGESKPCRCGPEGCSDSVCPGRKAEAASAPEQPADPYAELKAARAAGKTIQHKAPSGVWVDENPAAPWEFASPPDYYRIKPKDHAQPNDDADADGWIEWHGGECPVPENLEVEIRANSGWCASATAGNFKWDHHQSDPAFIFAYRLHKPEQRAEADDVFNAIRQDIEGLPDRVVDKVLRGNATTASAAAHWYLSGPMSGLPELNFPAFNRAAAKLRALGMRIVNPAEHQGLPDGSPWADYMRQDIRLLMDCQGIVMLPGWEQSNGARLEHHIAEALGLPVLVIDSLVSN